MIGQTGWADGEVVEEQGWWGFRGPETRSWKFPSFVCVLIETSQPRPPRVTPCYQPAAGGGSEKDEGKKKKKRAE